MLEFFNETFSNLSLFYTYRFLLIRQGEVIVEIGLDTNNCETGILRTFDVNE